MNLNYGNGTYYFSVSTGTYNKKYGKYDLFFMSSGASVTTTEPIIKEPESSGSTPADTTKPQKGVAYSFDVKNISDSSSPKKGKVNINDVQGTGDTFEFTAETSQSVREISICGDKPDNTLWHEISYDYLKENYRLSYVDDSTGKRKWTCRFSINEVGERTFMLKIDGQETNYKVKVEIYENKIPEKQPQSSEDKYYLRNNASFSDVSNEMPYSESIKKIVTIGNIIGGYEDGTFKPDNYVTRAEVTKMVIAAMGDAYLKEAEKMKGKTDFSDVESTHWASGYINVGVSQFIINGMGDGKFNPYGEVTYVQLIKMLCSIIGYKNEAEKKGGWPYGYLEAAKESGLTRGLSLDKDDKLTRAQVAKLIDNFLETPMVGITSWTTDIYGKPIAETEIMNGKGEGGIWRDILSENHNIYNLTCDITSVASGSAKIKITQCNPYDSKEIYKGAVLDIDTSEIKNIGALEGNSIECKVKYDYDMKKYVLIYGKEA